MEKQNSTNTEEVVSYSKDKIQLLFNILNSMSFTGIQQAQGIAQIKCLSCCRTSLIKYIIRSPY